jgi:hypothetical protein
MILLHWIAMVLCFHASIVGDKERKGWMLLNLIGCIANMCVILFHYDLITV